AYGGWTMDDHHPAGFRTNRPATIFHPAPSPFGIPYRCLYSVNIPNLFFAGRNISVTHAAFSSIRVMATCALCGQAAGTAAALALAAGCDPKGVDVKKLQAALMEDDCFLPGFKRPIAALTRNARITAGGENISALLDGVDRDRPEENHHWTGQKGDTIRLDLAAPSIVQDIRLVFDSDLDRKTLPELEVKLPRGMLANRHLNREPSYPPKTLIRHFILEGTFANGHTEILAEESNNYQRLRRYAVHREGLTAVTFVPLETWGAENFHLFSFEAR
ncbi:MAG: FAD-dependent oxidoreductase, partial [Clostridiales bacterium]|nr:FAD-dependent oxidoreductase [Clostridiales bacterium]